MIVVAALVAVLALFSFMYAFAMYEGRNDAFGAGILIAGTPALMMICASSAASALIAYGVSRRSGRNAGTSADIGAGVFLCIIALCCVSFWFNQWKEENDRKNRPKAVIPVYTPTPTPTLGL